MADLVYKIGADITDLEKGVSNAETTIKSLGSAIDKNVTGTLKQSDAALGSFDSNLKEVNQSINNVTNAFDDAKDSADGLSNELPKLIPPVVVKTIGELESELKQLRIDLKGFSGQELSNANLKVKDLEGKLKDLKTKGLDGLPKSADKGAYALSSLGNVAKDLPFGFIAIQNNIPAVFESFGKLSKESGGAIEGFKELFSSLAGPSGVAFGIGVATSAITGLIQEYGSLGEAFNQILGITKPLTDGQIAYNKALYEAAGGAAAEEAKISILTKTLLNNKKPQSDRISAYNELNKVAPELVAGINEENALTTESNLLIQANAETRKRSIQLKIQEAGINAVLQTNETKLAELRQKLTLADQEYVKSAANLNKAQKQGLVTGFASQTQQQTALTDFNNSANAVTNLRNQINALTKEQDGYLNQLDPIVNGIAAINTETQNRIKAAKDQESQEKKAADELERAAKSAKNYKYELQSLSDIKLTPQQLDIKNNIDQLQELANVVLNVAESDKKRLEALNQLKSIAPAIFNGLSIEKSGLDKVRAGIDVVNEGYLRELDYINKVNKARLTIVEPRVTPNLTPTPSSPFVIPEIPPSAAEALKLFAANANLAKLSLDELKKATNLQAAYNLISDTFFNPVQELFNNFIETGKLAFSDFAKSILKAINQIVAKIIATGIISLIANILFPGAGGAGATLGEKVVGDIGKALGFSFGGKVAAPSFAGVGGGALNMGGQVNVVLRGSDLIGSINRTNATINRVG